VKTAFYCVADERYFLGAVGLVNSLRLVGHDEPVFLLDCGLTAAQRERLSPEVTLVEGPRDAAPHVLKAIAPVRHPANTAVLIDTDMIATRSLAPLIERAREGRIGGGSAEMDRFCPEWGELLDLGELEPRPYLSTGLVLAGGELGAEVLRLVDERRDRVDFERTFWRRNVPDYPLLHADQDLINAAICARARRDEVFVFDPKLSAAPPFDGLRVLDAGTLRCGYADGTEPYVLHHWLTKPWLEPTHEGVYSRLLRRLLVGDDLAIRVPREAVPSRFRAGPRGWAERRLIDFRERRRR
jgi:hypothetical protein